MELLSTAIAIAPDFPEAYARRGLAYSEIGLRDQAFDDLTAAIRLHPTPAHYAYRGLVSIRAGQNRAAVRDLDYSLELQPAQHRAHNFFGVLHLTEDNAPEAWRSFDKGCANGDCSFLDIARQEGLCS